MKKHHLSSFEEIEEFMEVSNPAVRSTALSVVAGAPETIKANAQSWKTWIISNWVAHNIRYVSDPLGQEYVAYPSETLTAKAGDCDDFAILLATMYETVGLDAAFAWIDTDEDGEGDHACAMVYYPDSADQFLKDEAFIMKQLKLEPLSAKRYLMNRKAPALEGTIRSYPWGIWILVDPLAPGRKDLVGNIMSEPYEPVHIIDVGYK